MKLTISDLGMIQKALKNTIKTELDSSIVDYNFLMELSVITSRVDQHLLEDQKVQTNKQLVKQALNAEKKIGAPSKINKKLVIELLADKRMNYAKIAKIAKCSKASVCRINSSLAH